MRPSLHFFCFVSCLATGPLLIAQEETRDVGWGARVIQQSSFSENQAEGQIDFLAPLWGNEDSLIFLYPSLGLSSDIDPGFSFGVGMRQFVKEWNAIFGISAFFDRYDSPFGNYYNQLGLTGEVLTDRFDFRFNYYIPEGDRNLIDSQESSRRSQQTVFDSPYATGHQILQEVTITTTTVSQLFERFEESMQGFDTELGVPIPIFGQFGEVKMFVGYYEFENEFGDDLSGVKSRAELRFSEKLAIDATWYEDEEMAGDNWVFGFRMNLPVAMENLDHGGNPFQDSFAGLFGKGGGNAASYPYSSTGQIRRRMLEEVLRSNQVQTSESDFIENLQKREIDRDIDKETKVIASDIIFVNNGGAVGNGIQAGQANGNGTAERPTQTVGMGVEKLVSRLGGSGTVYVQGNRPQYVEDVSVGFDGSPTGSNNGTGVRNVVLTSSYKGIQACGGHVFGGDTARPVVSGFNVRGGTSGTVNSATIEGFSLTGLLLGPNEGNAIYAENVPVLEISCNQIHSTLDEVDAIRVLYDLGNTGDVAIFENQITKTGNFGDAIDIDTRDDAILRANIRNNLITTSGENSDAIDFGAFDDSLMSASVTQNTVTTTGDFSSAFDFDSEDLAFFSMVVRDNVFQTTADDANAVDVEAEDGSFGFFLFQNNRIVTTGDESEGFDFTAEDGAGLIVATVSNNVRTTGDDSYGLDINATDGTLIDVTSFNDRIVTTGEVSDGISVDMVGGALAFVTVERAQILTQDDDAFGFFVIAEDGAEVTIELFDSRISTRGDSAPGFVVIADSAAPIDVTLGGNVISTIGATSDGIGVVPFQDVVYTADGNNIIIVTGAADDLFVAPAGGTASGTIIINDNVVSPPLTGDYP